MLPFGKQQENWTFFRPVCAMVPDVPVTVTVQVPVREQRTFMPRITMEGTVDLRTSDHNGGSRGPSGS
jgi:hypothetical protein